MTIPRLGLEIISQTYVNSIIPYLADDSAPYSRLNRPNSVLRESLNEEIIDHNGRDIIVRNELTYEAVSQEKLEGYLEDYNTLLNFKRQQKAASIGIHPLDLKYTNLTINKEIKKILKYMV